MSISLNVFQHTLSTTNAEGFVKLSGDGNSVKSYGDGFFARHFGLYTKPSAEENNAVRRAFYESVTSSIDCRGAVLDALRKDLGIGEDGSCTSGKQLSVREAKSILARVKAEATARPEGTSSAQIPKIAANGQHFDVTLGAKFQESFVKRLGSCLARADKADRYPDTKTAFFDALKDYARAGFGLKLGGSHVARIGEARDREADMTAMAGQIERFFKADTVNGERASRIIGDIVHQGILGDLMAGLKAAGEVLDFTFGPTLTNSGDFSVDRAEDGSYQIRVKGSMRYSTAFGDKDMLALDASRSMVRVDVSLNLSFDSATGEPQLVLSRPPTLSGTVTKQGYTFQDTVAITSPLNNRPLRIPSTALEISGELAKPDFRKAVTEALRKGDEAALADITRARIVTQDDVELLFDIGLSGAIVENMVTGLAGDESTPRLDKATMNRLRDPATRDAAIRDIKAMVQQIADAGFIERVPDIHVEVLNLITVAGLSDASASTGSSSYVPSDVRLVMDYIDKSDDQNVRNILADLRSGDPDTVAAAKTRAQDIARTQRQGLGLALLKNHIPDITNEQIATLQKHIPAAQYSEALQHIVDRDSFMDDAIDYFKAMIETAMALEKES